jgi:hypothetical protein
MSADGGWLGCPRAGSIPWAPVVVVLVLREMSRVCRDNVNALLTILQSGTNGSAKEAIFCSLCC